MSHRDGRLALAALVALAWGGGARADWPLAGGDPGRSGVAAAGPEQLAVAWSFDLDAPVDASPVVVGGVVYAASREGSVAALDAQSGALRWRVELNMTVVAGLACGGGVLCVGSVEGHLLALDLATGQVRWRHRAGGPIMGPPLIVAERVFVTSGDRTCYALRAATGEPVWSHQCKGELFAGATWADGRVIVADLAGHVYALDAVTGEPAWTSPAGGPVRASPVVVGGRVYVGAMNVAAATGKIQRMVCLLAADGTRVWAAEGMGSVTARPAVADGVIYFAPGTGYPTNAAKLFAHDATSGAAKWKKPPDLGSSMDAGLAVAAGRLYLATYHGVVRALNAKNAANVSSAKLGAKIHSSPAVDALGLFVGASDGKIHCLR